QPLWYQRCKLNLDKWIIFFLQHLPEILVHNSISGIECPDLQVYNSTGETKRALIALNAHWSIECDVLGILKFKVINIGRTIYRYIAGRMDKNLILLGPQFIFCPGKQ